MGKPILSHREVPFQRGTLAPYGEREAGQYSGAWMQVLRGNANESGDEGGGPRVEFSFLLNDLVTLESVCPEIGFNGRKSPAPLLGPVRSRPSLKIHWRE